MAGTLTAGNTTMGATSLALSIMTFSILTNWVSLGGWLTLTASFPVPLVSRILLVALVAVSDLNPSWSMDILPAMLGFREAMADQARGARRFMYGCVWVASMRNCWFF